MTKKIVQNFAKIQKKLGLWALQRLFAYLLIVEKTLARFRATWAAFKGTVVPTWKVILWEEQWALLPLSLTKIPLQIIPTTILQMLSFIFLIISDTCFWNEALNWSTLRQCVRGSSIINCWNKQSDLSKVWLLCALLFSLKGKSFHNSIWVESLSFEFLKISYEFSNIFLKKFSNITCKS